MKTILFFDRAELTYLYGRVTSYLEDVKVIHVAYSQKEKKILASMNIKTDFVYLDIFRSEYDNYTYDEQLLNIIDSDIVNYSGGRFNLNASIQSDRSFSLLKYDECLHSVFAHYITWKHIFSLHHVDLLMHEACSLFFNHIASILCNKQGGTYTFQFQAEGEDDKFYYMFSNNDDYNCWEIKENYKKYLESPDSIDRKRCEDFCNKFRVNQNVFFGNILKPKLPLWYLYYKAAKKFLINIIRRKAEDKKYNLIDYWLLSTNTPFNKIKNIWGYKRKRIKFLDHIPSGEKYFFYPLHLEPEAVVQYLGDGIYNNQIKLIENVAASLPPGYYLYVKDHPHEYAYRSPEDYERLQNIPNVRLLGQWLSGKQLIKGCEGLVTISGTAGFEAFLMHKNVYCFGKSMYSFHPHVNYIKNIRDLREIIYKNIHANYSDDDTMYAYIMAYLKSLHPGYINFFLGTANLVGINQDENAKVMAKDIVKYVKSLK